MLSSLAISLGIEMDPATGVPNFVNCAYGDTSFMLGNYEPDVCVNAYMCVIIAPFLSARRSRHTHSNC